MGAYILRRFLLMIPVALLVSVIIFALLRLTPGDPVRTMLGEEPDRHGPLVWLAGRNPSGRGGDDVCCRASAPKHHRKEPGAGVYDRRVSGAFGHADKLGDVPKPARHGRRNARPAGDLDGNTGVPAFPADHAGLYLCRSRWLDFHLDYRRGLGPIFYDHVPHPELSGAVPA